MVKVNPRCQSRSPPHPRGSVWRAGVFTLPEPEKVGVSAPRGREGRGQPHPVLGGAELLRPSRGSRSAEVLAGTGWPV